ncbi:MAG: dephospho-CoA kinase [Parachlamydiales bacterium]
MKKVAVTGGLASGKTTVCDIFHSLGAEVVHADAIVHQLLSSDSQIIQAVIRLIGQEALEGNQLNRAIIAKIVFDKPELLSSLEEILHPAVQRKIEERFSQVCASNDAPLFVAEIPLLFESGAEKFYDLTICVLADTEERQRRYLHRQKDFVNDFEKRQQKQWTQERKAELADIILYNNGSFEELKENITTLFHSLTQT